MVGLVSCIIIHAMITKALVENVTEVMLNFWCFLFLFTFLLSAFGERSNLLGDFGICRVRR